MSQSSLSRQSLQLLVAAALLVITIALQARAQQLDIEQVFRMADTNGDGRISRTEFEMKKVEIIFRRAQEHKTSLKFEETLISRAAFDAMDLDKDGVMTSGEVIASPIFNFETFDTNSDGYIDFNEFATQLRRMER
jgi:Ca2+-binding EF-hand superfamily protein